MRGHTREELEARGARLANYKYCENCGLFWANSVFKKHLNVRQPGTEEIAIISPAGERFLNALAELYVDNLVKKHTTVLPDGTKVLPNFVLSAESEQIARVPKTTYTVDEAVTKFGFVREELLAELERCREPFEIEIPAVRKHGPRRRSRAPTSPKRTPVK